MLFAGLGSVRIVKNYDLGLEIKMLASACGLGRHFQDFGHSFSLYRPTLSRQITYLPVSTPCLLFAIFVRALNRTSKSARENCVQPP